VAFGDGYKLVEKLNGNITLIIGNHDKKTNKEFCINDCLELNNFKPINLKYKLK